MSCARLLDRLPLGFAAAAGAAIELGRERAEAIALQADPVARAGVDHALLLHRLATRRARGDLRERSAALDARPDAGQLRLVPGDAGCVVRGHVVSLHSGVS